MSPSSGNGAEGAKIGCTTDSEFDLVAVDFDGTLADTEPIHQDCYRKLCSLLAINEPNVDVSTLGLQEDEIWQAMLGERPANLDALRDVRAGLFLGTVYEQRTEPSENVVSFLDRLAGSKMVLWTAQRSRIVEPLLYSWGLADRFMELYTADRRSSGQSKLDTLREILTGCDPDRILVVDDSPPILEAARQQQCRTAVVKRPYNAEAHAISDIVIQP